jgi:hypothetical protein
MDFKNIYEIIKSDNIDEFRKAFSDIPYDTILLENINYRPIHIAARYKAINIFNEILESGVKTNQQTCTGSNALHYCYYGAADKNMYKKILSKESSFEDRLVMCEKHKFLAKPIDIFKSIRDCNSDAYDKYYKEIFSIENIQCRYKIYEKRLKKPHKMKAIVQKKRVISV